MLFGAAIAAALLDLWATAQGWDGIRPLTKPLPAILLAVAAFRAPRVPRVFGTGLMLAATGDELLLHAGDAAFAAGMAAFAAMHACYISAFARIGSGPGLIGHVRWLALPFAAAVVATNVVLDPHAGAFALPLALYGALLGAMAACAFNASARIAPPGRYALPVGALLFMASDTALAFAKFVHAVPLSPPQTEIAIVGSYFAAQIAIARGAIAGAARVR